MFFLFALTAVLAYSIHDLFVTKISRNMDAISMTTYRGLSLAISMSPALLFASWDDIRGILEYLPELFAASICSVVGVFF